MTEKTQKERLLESLAKKKALDAEHSALCKEIQAEIEKMGEDGSMKQPEDGSYSSENQVLSWELEDGADPSIFLEFPITVTGFTEEARDLWGPGWRKEMNALVAIRPCGKQYEGKTYLGVYIGDAALSCTVYYQPNSGLLNYRPTAHNPAIYVPALEKIIFGAESWWGKIKSEDDLKAITDGDINSVWYVQAMKQLTGAEPKLPKEGSDGQAQEG